MANLLIFEGPQRAGKTTLLKAVLEQRPAIKLLHTGRRQGGSTCSESTYFDAYLDCLPCHSVFALDRHIHSNYVYNGYRGGNKLALMSAVEAFHAKHNVLLIAVTRPTMQVEDKGDGVSFTLAEDATICGLYDYLFSYIKHSSAVYEIMPMLDSNALTKVLAIIDKKFYNATRAGRTST